MTAWRISRTLQVFVWCSCCFAVFGSAQADKANKDAPEKVSFYNQIRPIFQAHCHGCHQPAKPNGKYVMTSFDKLLAGGESELASVTPGDPDDSYLMDLIIPDDEGKAEMPKARPPLSKSDIDLIARWIREGATDDTPAGAKDRYDKDHPPTYTLPPIITTIHFSPGGQFLAVAGFHEVLLHKADGSELVGRLIGMSARIESVRFSPDGKLLAVTGGLPGRMGEVQVWDVEKQTLKISFPVTYDTIYGASWSPDGKLVAFGCGDNSVRAIDVTTGKQIFYNAAHNDWVLDSVFSAGGTHLVSVSRDMSMKLFVVTEQRFVDNITSITPGALKGGLATVDRHPTKDELVVGGSDGVPKTFLMHRTKARKIGDDYQKIRAFGAMPGRVFAVSYNSDGSRIVAGSSSNGQGQVRVYQSGDGKLVWKLATTPVYAVDFQPDNKVVAAAGFDGTLRLIDAADGKLIKEFVPVPLAEKKVAAAEE